ncbi:altronate dehydratase family protein [Treponema sp. OttesenSCG-928-L16]|nr:altronate dehydratase family protein [Treponema sp. OttesenSCG-928-L16]
MIRLIQVDKRDNVAIPAENVSRGDMVQGNIQILDDIPQGHKIALADLAEGDPVIRYGVKLGFLNRPVPKGGLITEHMLNLPEPPALDSLKPEPGIHPRLPETPVKEFEGYDVPGSPYAGTRNILGIMTTVQCVSGVLDTALKRMREELLPKYPMWMILSPSTMPTAAGSPSMPGRRTSPSAPCAASSGILISAGK